MAFGKARPAEWGSEAVGKLLACSPSSEGVQELATVQAGLSVCKVPLGDLIWDGSTQSLKVNDPGDRIGFAICRPFDGREMELAAVVNGVVLKKFQYFPQRNDGDAPSPPSCLLALYAGDSGALDVKGKKALCRHLALTAQRNVSLHSQHRLESELTAADCDAAAAELEQAANSGHLSSRLRSLWTWRNIFDKYSDVECGEILQDGLVLLVIDCMRQGLSSELGWEL
jgi:hypothetical protein